MKIRNNFISNSSSTSFIILMPDNIDKLLNKDIIVKYLDEDFDLEDDDEKKKEILDALFKAIKAIKKHGQAEFGDYDESNSEYYIGQILKYIIPKKYILFDIEGGCDGDDVVAIITKEYINNKMENLK